MTTHNWTGLGNVTDPALVLDPERAEFERIVRETGAKVDWFVRRVHAVNPILEFVATEEVKPLALLVEMTCPEAKCEMVVSGGNTGERNYYRVHYEFDKPSECLLLRPSHRRHVNRFFFSGVLSGELSAKIAHVELKDD